MSFTQVSRERDNQSCFEFYFLPTGERKLINKSAIETTSNTTLDMFKASSTFEKFLTFIHRNSAVKDTSTYKML